MKNVIQHLTIAVFLILPAVLFAAPIPISSCGTVISTSGTYALTTDLNCSSGDGVEILANKVTLLLSGHTMTGPGTTGNFPVGVYVLEDTSVDIVGPGTITNFPFGVSFQGAVTSGLVGATLNQNGSAILVANGSSGPSKSLVIAQNTGSGNGISGMYITGMNSSRIVGNTFSNTFVGFEVNGSANTFEGNVVYNGTNGGEGFYLQSGSGNTIVGNQFYNNYIGMENGSTGNHYEGNLLFGNNDIDIYETSTGCKGDTFKIDIFSTANQSCVK